MIGFIYGVVAAMTWEEGFMGDNDLGGIQSLVNREKLQKKRSEQPHHLWKHNLPLICSLEPAFVSHKGPK